MPECGSAKCDARCFVYGAPAQFLCVCGVGVTSEAVTSECAARETLDVIIGLSTASTGYVINNGRMSTRDVILSDENRRCRCDADVIDPDCDDECDILRFCLNDGIFVSDLGRRRCKCREGFYGDRCEFVNPCSDVTCSNNAVCVNTSQTEYECKCADGFFGENCQKFDPCSRTPCQHGGVCHNVTQTLFTCTCSLGHYGAHCEHLDPCFSQPCQNSGECSNTSTSTYTCSCREGFMGANCELYQPCNFSPCLNGGLCNSEDGLYYCDCPPGFFGRKCESVNLCVHLQPCGAHAKSCVNITDDSYECVCETGE